MSGLVITSVGNNKVTVIKVVRELTGLGLAEAKEIVDRIEIGDAYEIKHVSTEELAKAKAQLDAVGVCYEAEDDVVDMRHYSVENEKNIELASFEPCVSPNEVHLLDRQGTITVLEEVKRIVEKLEQCDHDIKELKEKIVQECKKVEELRNALSPKAKMIIRIVLILAFIIGTCIGTFFGGVVITIVAYIVLSKTVKKKDLEEHRKENNANADAYALEYVEPLKQQLEHVSAEKSHLIQSGMKAWALDVIGEEFLFSFCVNDILELVKSRRADSLKEALNVYDATIHRARMEEMQAAIQNASEVAAIESIKQTEYSRQTAKSAAQTAQNTHRAAVAARNIDKNTRRFR